MAHMKEVAALERLAKEKGLRCTWTEGHHLRIADAAGRYTIIAGTPGSYGAIKRARSHIMKLATGRPLTKDIVFHGAGTRASNAG